VKSEAKSTAPSRRRRAQTWWPWLLLVLVAAYSGAHWAGRVIPDSIGSHDDGRDRAFMDFDVYLTGARQLAAGHSVYAPTDTLPRPPCVGGETMEYIYTPLLALLLRPWTALSPCAAERLWFLLNCLACAALPPLLMLALRLPRTPAWWAFALGITTAPMATLETVSLGQVNALVLALMLGFVILAGRERASVKAPAAAMLALAAGLKLVPVALALVLLRRGRRGLLFGTAAAVVVVVALSFLAAPSSSPAAFLRAVDERTVGGLTQLNNASWVAAVARAHEPGPAAIRLLVRANLLLVLLTAAAGWWRSRADGGALRLIALGFALSTAMSPVFEAHHQMLLYPCLLVLSLAVSRETRPLARGLGWGGVALLGALLNSRGLVPVARADGLLEHLLVKPAGVALWLLIIWLLCLRPGRLE
jgi:alpha-1,2-mannosyltransferase